jgi:[protein-PII] uridylyltransferase
MNELGVLSAFLPEFAPVVAMMQFNMYHSYTVDEHTIQVISTLAQIEREELIEELPVASRILKAGVNRKVLYIACLLHDIGKGRKEDHSIVGARIARAVCPRLGPETRRMRHGRMAGALSPADVRHGAEARHLRPAHRARFRQGGEDAGAAGPADVLTVCDIRGVGPNTWNNWKATLLRGLFRATATALETGLEDLNREKLEGEGKRRCARRWRLAQGRRQAEIDRHYGPYWQGLDVATQVTSPRCCAIDATTRSASTPARTPTATPRASAFALADHPGIFSPAVAGALSLVGANVVDARTYTTKDGFATAVFWVQDADGNPYEAARLPRLTGMIEKTLKGEVVASEALAGRDKIKKRERPFDVPTHITFDNEGSEIYTIIEVDTRDRPGLLYDLTKTLAAANVYIAHAVIATYGAQVVDTFYVKDMFGLKLHTRSRQQSLERKLRDAIARVAERAGA